jgi:hypothetical protein
MVVDAYIKQHSLVCCLRGRRRAIERLGIGWPLLLSSPTYLPTKVTLPSSPSNLPSGSALQAAGSGQSTSGVRTPVQTKEPRREGGDG